MYIQIKYRYGMSSYRVSKDSDNSSGPFQVRIGAPNHQSETSLAAVCGKVGHATLAELNRASRPRRTALVVARVMIHLSSVRA